MFSINYFVGCVCVFFLYEMSKNVCFSNKFVKGGGYGDGEGTNLGAVTGGYIE